MPALKKTRRLYILLTLFLLCTSYYHYGQSAIIDTISSHLKSYTQRNFQEKIFAHTDKSFYVCGEIIWFKLYNTDAYLNKPLNLSKVAYVELLSSDHKPVLQAKIELTEGTGSGSLMLPFSLNSGSYVLRAYTNWMKNYSPDLFFEAPITIINTLKKLTASTTDSIANDIRFFPEGGNLVNGLQSKVAFHATGKNGKGLSCKGIIYNQNNDSITSFQSLRFGMGSFSFTPVKGDTYRAVAGTADGGSVSGAIPAAFETGYVMRLSQPADEKIRITVHSSNNNEFISLLVHTRQVIKKAETNMVTGGVAEFTIDKKELGPGVSHFIVFNNNRQPVCERSYFARPLTKLNIGITTNQEAYSLRKKVSIELSLPDTSQPSAEADISLSVFRTDSLQFVDESDIQSYFWLSSELRGVIESPSWYFNSTGDQSEEIADNLMLTHGWSRFRWEDVTPAKKPSFQYLPEYEGPIITGKIREKSSGLPQPGVIAYLTVPGDKFIFKTHHSDRNGNILFNLNNFYGSTDIIVQSFNKQKAAYLIDIATPFATNFSSRNYPPLQISEKRRQELLVSSVGTQAENTFVKEKKQRFYRTALTDSTTFFGKPDKTYLLDDYTRFITLEEVMREYVSEVRVRKIQDQFSYRVKNIPYQAFFDTDPLVLLDGVPVFDVTKLMEFDPLKIRKLDVLARKFFSGGDIIEGIVSYTTYKGDLDGFQIDPSALILDYEGLQLQREFYSPVYATIEQAGSRLPDFRNLLFWSPDIKLKKKGNKQVDFYTSDRPGKYAVVVQGINSNGLAGSTVGYFTVKK